MNRFFLSNRGQFLPITAMVVLSVVVFLVAVVNIFQISRAKLKVQNLADAIALNLASQEASQLNAVTDNNEWLNHFYSDAILKSAAQQKKGLLPGISEIDASNGKYTFTDKDQAKSYANLVHQVNQAQQKFIDTYNSFLGAQGTTTASMWAILINDIRELDTDHSLHVIVWNWNGAEADADNELKNILKNPPPANQISNLSPKPYIRMNNLVFSKHPVQLQYWIDKKKGKRGQASMGELLSLKPDDVGWMELKDDGYKPSALLKLQGKDRLGVSVIVTKYVPILYVPALGATKTVVARSLAYVVHGSGSLPTTSMPAGATNPVFKPTFFVRLAK